MNNTTVNRSPRAFSEGQGASTCQGIGKRGRETRWRPEIPWLRKVQDARTGATPPSFCRNICQQIFYYWRFCLSESLIFEVSLLFWAFFHRWHRDGAFITGQNKTFSKLTWEYAGGRKVSEAYDGVALSSKEVPTPPGSPTRIIATPWGKSTFPSPRLQSLLSRGETVGHRLADVCPEQERRARQQRPSSSLAGTAH